MSRPIDKMRSALDLADFAVRVMRQNLRRHHTLDARDRQPWTQMDPSHSPQNPRGWPAQLHDRPLRDAWRERFARFAPRPRRATFALLFFADDIS
jgi:hypothetical protein